MMIHLVPSTALVLAGLRPLDLFQPLMESGKYELNGPVRYNSQTKIQHLILENIIL